MNMWTFGFDFVIVEYLLKKLLVSQPTHHLRFGKAILIIGGMGAPRKA